MSNRSDSSGRPLFVFVWHSCSSLPRRPWPGCEWQQWTPSNACLFCVTPEADATPRRRQCDWPARAPAARSGGRRTAPAAAAVSMASATGGSRPREARVRRSSGCSKQTAARGTWQPWGTARRDRCSRLFAAASGSHVVFVGRLVAADEPARPGHQSTAAATVAQNVEKPARVRTAGRVRLSRRRRQAHSAPPSASAPLPLRRRFPATRPRRLPAAPSARAADRSVPRTREAAARSVRRRRRRAVR